jgi:hypothetical protein
MRGNGRGERSGITSLWLTNGTWKQRSEGSLGASLRLTTKGKPARRRPHPCCDSRIVCGFTAFSPHGRGVMRGATVGNGVVAVGEGVAVATGFGVATCACALPKNATEPTRAHTLTKAIPDRIRALAAGCRS